MGGVMERLEVLLIALVLLLAGIVTGVLMFVRPPAAAYLQTVPQPVATRAALPGGDPSLASLPPATLASITASPAPPVTVPAAEAVPSGTPAFSHIADIPLRLPSIWPWMVLLAGLSALPLILIRFRRQRMAYTNQNVEQLLATSDPVTRASNVQIMRRLAEQGVLTSELAAAAGIDLRRSRRPLLARLPQLRLRPWRLPPIALPALRMPATNLPRLRLGRTQWRAAIANLLRSGTAIEAADCAGESVDAQNHLPIQDTQASTISVMPRAHGEAAGDPWTAEERVRAAVAVIAAICSEWCLHSQVAAVDTPRRAGSGPVMVTFEAHPGDEMRLDEFPMRVVGLEPRWRATWRRNLLTIVVQTDGATAPTAGPMLLPVLAHGRGGNLIRFLPLASWRHLGLYGADALRALHAMLGEVLFVQPPADLALMIIDRNEILPLYRDVAHHMASSIDGDETLTRLADAIRQLIPTSTLSQQARSLLVVVVEPDDARLRVLHRLITRLRAAPDTHACAARPGAAQQCGTRTVRAAARVDHERGAGQRGLAAGLN